MLYATLFATENSTGIPQAGSGPGFMAEQD